MKTLLIGLIVVVCSLVFLGCTKEQPDQAPASAPPNSTPQTSENPTTLPTEPLTALPMLPPPATLPVIPPGKSLLGQARVLHNSSVDLKAGETKSIDVTLETRNEGPGEFSSSFFRTDKEYGRDRLSMPNGLEVSIEPQKVMASPNNTYHLTITIKTSAELTPGEYWLRFERNFEHVSQSTSWISVTIKYAP